MDMNNDLIKETINVLNDRLRMYQIIKDRCKDLDDIVEFCDFQIIILKIILE